jgi:DNA-binding beta-propeller fold protein YncE
MQTGLFSSALLALAAGVAGTAHGVAAEAPKFYQLESALAIPSSHVPDWDYMNFDPTHNYVYIARREDGILTYDAVAQKLVGKLENTEGSNATTLVPELDRIFVTNEDGTLTVVQQSTLKTLARVKVGASADNSFYDPVTGQLLVTMGDERRVSFVNASTQAVVGTVAIDSEKIEGAVADGLGNFYVALRDRDQVVRVDVRQRKVTAEFKPDKCVMPNSLAFDMANKRLLVGCRGEHPVLAVVSPEGKTLSTTPIGRGIDAIVFDDATRRVYTANGFDATLVILNQLNGDHYTLAEAVTTRPYARTMALDPKTKKVYMVCAEGTVDVSKKWKSAVTTFYPNKYFMNTFTLLTYSRR